MTFADVLTFIEEHKEDQDVADWMDKMTGADNPLDKAKVLEFVGTPEGKDLIQPIIDQNVTKAVKTRDKAHEQVFEAELKKRVAAEVLKLNPQEEPWQKEMRELREENEKEKAERNKADLKRAIVEEAAKQGIEPFFLDSFVPPSLEEGNLLIQRIKEFIKKAEERKVNELMAGGFKPGAGNEANQKNTGKMDGKTYASLPFEERIAMVESGEIANVKP